MVPKKIKFAQLRYHWEVYLFIIPTLALIALFQYYPAASGIFHSFFRWNGADIAEYVGWGNYSSLARSEEFWNSFRVAFIIGAWNILKMIPPLLVAVCIHRCRGEKIQFFYRCLFVVPMVLPGLIIAMVWRTFFFEASSGYLNRRPVTDVEERIRRLVRRLALPARDAEVWLGILRQIVWKMRSEKEPEG
jgi:ABC-type sugar transport system permease subunit